jgi:hypothetical protein
MLGFFLSSVLPILSVFGTMVPHNFLPIYNLSQILERVPNCWFGAVRPMHFYFVVTIFRKLIYNVHAIYFAMLFCQQFSYCLHRLFVLHPLFRLQIATILLYHTLQH